MLRSLRVTLLGAALTAVLLPSAVAAQGPMRVWVGGGLGAAGPLSSDTSRGSEGLGVGVGQLVFQRGAHYVAVRALGAVDLLYGSGDSYGELDALYGRAYAARYVHLALATGVAYTSVPCGGVRNCDALGLPVLAELAVRPLPILGIGVQGFLNVNQHRSYGGLVGMAQLGWMP